MIIDYPEIGDIYVRKSTGLVHICTGIWTGLRGYESATLLSTHYGKIKHPIRYMKGDFEYLGKSKIDLSQLFEIKEQSDDRD